MRLPWPLGPWPTSLRSRLHRQGSLALRSLCHEGLGFLTLWPRVQRSVPGWGTAPDSRLLFALAHHGPGRGSIIEIGSAWGRSTVFLARGSKQAGRERVYAIDPHTGDPWFLQGVGAPVSHLDAPGYRQTERGAFSSFEGFRHTIRRFGVEDWVVPVVATSTDAVTTLDTGPIRLLFIDGLHTYEGVKTDIAQWVPRVVPGGAIVFDDYFNTNDGVGVRRAVNELLVSGSVEPRLRHNHGYLVWTLKR
jgi:hypothetical protein